MWVGGDHTASLTRGWESHKYQGWTFYCYRIRTPQPPHVWHLHSNKHEHFPSAKLTKHKTHHLKVIRHPRHRLQEASNKWPQLPLSGCPFASTLIRSFLKGLGHWTCITSFVVITIISSAGFSEIIVCPILKQTSLFGASPTVMVLSEQLTHSEQTPVSRI